jgi:hypothetical protein
LQCEEVATKLLEETPHDEFVDAGREEESDDHGCLFADFEGGDTAVVDVAEEEVVDWSVPVSRILIPGYYSVSAVELLSATVLFISKYVPLFHQAS